MRIWLVDESTLAKDTLTFPVLEQIAAVLTVQAHRDFGGMHESAGADVYAVPNILAVPQDDCAIVIQDNPDQDGALGDHETNAAGRPVGRIFLGPILQNAGGRILTGPFSLASVISHEVLEACFDPYVNAWYDGNDGRQYAAEVCDPVESDSYEIDGVTVSNFIGPRWFSAGPGPFDFMRKLSGPFTMSSGGYLIVRDPGGTPTPVFGDTFPDWKKTLKARRVAARS